MTGRKIARLTTRGALIEKDGSEKIPRVEEQIRLDGLQGRCLQNPTEALPSLRTLVTDPARIVSAQSGLSHDVDKRTAVLEDPMGRVMPRDR